MTRRGDGVRLELYYQLRARGVAVRTDYVLPTRSPRARSGWFTPDLALCRQERCLAIVHAGPVTRQRVRENYARADMPAFWADLANLHELAEALSADPPDLTALTSYRIHDAPHE